MSFSERYGYKPVRETLQVEYIDKILRTKLWNRIYNFLAWFFEGADISFNELIQITESFYSDFFIVKTNKIPTGNIITYLDERYENFEWTRIYDLIEFIISTLEKYISKEEIQSFIDTINHELMTEKAGYRVINGQVTQITSEAEISEIEEALKNTDKYLPVKQHLETALKHLSDRNNPDYRNCIKESISAIEALCIIITNTKKDPFKKALQELENKHKIHSTLREGFIKLYAYTNDGGGMRHALLEDSVELEFEDAKFMYVSCTSFINYLIVKL